MTARTGIIMNSYAGSERDIGRAVGRPIIDDELLDLADPDQRTRQRAEHSGDPRRIVQARDLDDELHSLREATGGLHSLRSFP